MPKQTSPTKPSKPADANLAQRQAVLVALESAHEYERSLHAKAKRSAFTPALSPEESDTLRELAMLDGVPEPFITLMLPGEGGPMAAYDALKKLLGMDYTVAEICHATGLKAAKVDGILRLGNLIPEVAELARAGGLPPAIIKQLAAMPHGQQRQAVALAQTEPREQGEPITIKRKHVSDVKHATAQDAVQTLPAALFNPAPAVLSTEPAPARTQSWEAQVAEEIKALLTRVPESETRTLLQEALNTLEAPAISVNWPVKIQPFI